MNLESEILSDLRQLLTEHGVNAQWKSIALLVLVSRVKREQQIDLGGFVKSAAVKTGDKPAGLLVNSGGNSCREN